MPKSYIPISIGNNCNARFAMQEALPITHKIPFFPFDWCITGDLLDVARAINSKFKGYLSYIYVNNLNNSLDTEKIKKILLEKKYITKKDADKKFGGTPGWKTYIPQIHKNYPSILELHYDFKSNDVVNKIQNRINRMNKVIAGKKPILFIRIILPKQMTLFPFFNYTYDEGLQNCHTFVDTLKLDKKRDFKVLFIHVTLAKDKDIVKHETFGNIDAHEIQSTKPKKYDKAWEDFIIPYIKKYKLAVEL
jgi:hypothetical protein